MRIEREVDILLCPYWATWSAVALEKVLEGVASQTGVDWRLIVVDGTRDKRVIDMVHSIVPASRLEYDHAIAPKALSDGARLHQGSLYWQATMGVKARYVAYTDPRAESGRVWSYNHLFMMTELLGRGRADVVFSGDMHFECDADAIGSLVRERPIVPLGTAVHRADIYKRLLKGWDRNLPGDQEHAVFAEMACLRPAVKFYYFGMETARPLVQEVA